MRILPGQKANSISPHLRVAILLWMAIFLSSCDRDLVWAEIPPTTILTASWYSIDSLKKEGTYKHSKGVMANGKLFRDNELTCATRLYPLCTRLHITNLSNNKSVIVIVTDRIGKRFAETRVDLSRLAFSRIAKLKEGIIKVKIKIIK